ncbi:yae1 domain-containing protein 1 [Lingula anatina]|uniref:Yae1 domain-containing protein 1 n=1 Tax=Lingula anatina TaxID=7574 RepID=A0A1S3KDW2_LINAN|nr:yae1 domain-containing protein 1 [Lingula anatina]|eukprot:XP_013420815.1 yae1 domain-containing protein 1 [Lingula anatina]
MAHSNHIDDIFDEDADDILLSEKEWQNLRRNRVKDGYREGLEEGKESQLQSGFNQGYEDAVDVVFQVAKLRGSLCALISYTMLQGGEEPPHSQDAERMSAAKCLLEEVTELEREVKENLRTLTSAGCRQSGGHEGDIITETHPKETELVIAEEMRTVGDNTDFEIKHKVTSETTGSSRKEPLQTDIVNNLEEENEINIHCQSCDCDTRQNSGCCRDQKRSSSSTCDCRHKKDKLKPAIVSAVLDSSSLSTSVDREGIQVPGLHYLHAEVLRLEEAFVNLMGK